MNQWARAGGLLVRTGSICVVVNGMSHIELEHVHATAVAQMFHWRFTTCQDNSAYQHGVGSIG